RKAVFWSVNGGVSGFSYTHARNLLKDRGYEVIAGGCVEMPDTFMFLKESQLTPEQRRGRLEKALSQISDNLKVIDVLPKPKRENIFKVIIGAIVAFPYLFWGRHVLGLSFVATSQCVRCKKCVQDCPVHAIIFGKDRPKWGTGCVGCFRCVNNCPVAAIDFSKYVLIFGLVGAIICAVVLGILNEREKNRAELNAADSRIAELNRELL
ncbi:MAG: EFR1 family ferrodoxin, partial [Clostridia bacterium]|nr:EFR1 family ferrodoxin [Clostridia bacterium]